MLRENCFEKVKRVGMIGLRGGRGWNWGGEEEWERKEEKDDRWRESVEFGGHSGSARGGHSSLICFFLRIPGVCLSA